MNREMWDRQRLPAANFVWQLFHENSKTTRFRRPISEERLMRWQSTLAPSLCYDGHPAVTLPPPLALTEALEKALRGRRSAGALRRDRLSLETLATILFFGYGILRPTDGDEFPFGYRAVPSGGALFPLEVYVHISNVEGLAPGIYHYEPHANVVRRFIDGDQSDRLAASIVQSSLVSQASAFVFITALFDRTTTKYGERGYRFALIETGHVGQNLALCAAALGLAGTPIGGFVDSTVDELLEIDGINQSTLYAFALGGRLEEM
jgi:SagB-type dehydrogenase family enzyme